MRKDVPLAVEVPNAERDKPAWVKVGVIAAVGFVVGIAWPRVVGVKLGPNAPGEATSAASASHTPGRAPDAPPASVAAKAATSLPSAPASSTPAAVATSAVPPNIVVQRGTVLSCKTTEGETKKGRECGTVNALDQLVGPRVKKISTCSGVEGQTGKLSLVVNADFASGRLWYDIGKASTVGNLEAVASCLKTSFHGTSIDKLAHEHTRYTVVYNAVFAPGTADPSDHAPAAHKDKPDPKERNAKEAAPDDAKSETPGPASSPPANAGEASVAWEVALVRDVPKTGSVVARLPRGTRVHVGAPKDGWFSIRFGENFASEGYVYRGAIGR